MKKIIGVVIFLVVVSSTLSFAKNEAYKANKKSKLPTSLSKIWAESNKILPYIDSKGYIVIESQISQPLIVCKLSHICILELAKNEVLVGDNPIELGLDQWRISSNVYDRDGDTITSLSLKPSNNEGETSLVLYTNYGSHNVRLIATSNKFMSKSRFADKLNQNVGKRIVQATKKHTALKEENQVQQRVQNQDLTINDNYKIVSEKSIKWKPLFAYDNAIQTFISLSKNAEKYNAVRVVSIKNETEHFVNYKFLPKKNRIVVDGIYEKLYLSLDNEEVFIINNSY